jgi:hypothetical protein
MSDSIPDLLGELRCGRYPYDFVRALTGEIAGANANRALMLEQMLKHERAGDVITAMLLAGGRFFLNEFAKAEPQAFERGLARLAEAGDAELDRIATYPADLFRRGN